MNRSIVNKVNDYYDKSTDSWIEVHDAKRIEGFSFDRNVEVHDKILESFFKFKPGEKILDAGCGVGYPGINFAKKYTYTNFYLVNINKYQLDKVDQVLPNMSIFNCDFNNLIFPVNFFDKVYFLESFSHSLKKSTTVKEIYRVLKPGGRVFLLDFCRKKDAKNDKVKIHRNVYAHFPVYSKLFKKLFLNYNFTEDFFLEDLNNNIFIPDKFDTNTFYCYDKSNKLTKFGEVHKEIYEQGAHVQYPIFCCFKKNEL